MANRTLALIDEEGDVNRPATESPSLGEAPPPDVILDALAA